MSRRLKLSMQFLILTIISYVQCSVRKDGKWVISKVGKIGIEESEKIYNDIVYVYQYPITMDSQHLVVESSVSPTVSVLEAVMFDLRREAYTDFWNLPLVTSNQKKLTNYTKTICTGDLTENVYYPSIWSAAATKSTNNDSYVLITVTTLSEHNVTFSLTVSVKSNVLKLGEARLSNLTLTSPNVYYVENSRAKHDSSLLKLSWSSNDSSCATVSIQPFLCPFLDKTSTIKFRGVWFTMTTNGAITLRREDYPTGFFIIVLLHDNDDSCMPKSASTSQNVLDRTKLISYIVTEPISDQDMHWWILITFVVFTTLSLLFFLLPCMSHLLTKLRCFPNPEDPLRQQDGNEEDQQGLIEQERLNDKERGALACTHYGCGYLRSLVEFIYSIVYNMNSQFTYFTSLIFKGFKPAGYLTLDKMILLNYSTSENNMMSENNSSEEANDQENGNIPGPTNRNMMSENNSSEEANDQENGNIPGPTNRNLNQIQDALHQRHLSYFWFIIAVLLYFSMPAIQLVIFDMTPNTNSTSMDTCFHNFNCSFPMYGVYAINNVISSLTFLFFGVTSCLIFILDYFMGERNPQTGVSSTLEFSFTLSFVMIALGVSSICYSICPNESNHHFSTSILYVGIILIGVQLYHSRHPTTNVGPISMMLLLSCVELLDFNGKYFPTLLYFVFFHLLYLFGLLVLAMKLLCHGTHSISYIFAYLWNTQAPTEQNSPEPSTFNRENTSDESVPRTSNISSNIHNNNTSQENPFFAGKDVQGLVFVGILMNLVFISLRIYYFVLVDSVSVDFESYIQTILIANINLYVLYYIVMKLVHEEQITVLSAITIAFAIWGWISAFLEMPRNSTWVEMPAVSREFNKDCINPYPSFMNGKFYDSEDWWRLSVAKGIGSTLALLYNIDGPLQHTRRDRIAVF